MEMEPDSLQLPGGPPQGSQQRIYGALKARIVNCEMPPGETVYEDRIAQEFGTSRTPVREALLKLRNDNLVSIIPRKGTFVSHITVQDVYEIYQIRRLLEPGIAVLVRDDVDPERLHAFSLAFETLKTDTELLPEWFEVDREFHTYLAECTRNRSLITIYDGIMNHQQRISILASRLPGRLENTVTEHQNIIAALVKKYVAAIEDSINTHITAAWEASLRIEQLIR